MSENLWFFDVFRGVKKWNILRQQVNYCTLHSKIYSNLRSSGAVEKHLQKYSKDLNIFNI